MKGKPVLWLNNAGQAPLSTVPKIETAGIQAILRHPWETSPHAGSISYTTKSIRESFASLIDCSDPSDIAITANVRISENALFRLVLCCILYHCRPCLSSNTDLSLDLPMKFSQCLFNLILAILRRPTRSVWRPPIFKGC